MVPSRALPIPWHARISLLLACNRDRKLPKRCNMQAAVSCSDGVSQDGPTMAASNSLSVYFDSGLFFIHAVCAFPALSGNHRILRGLPFSASEGLCQEEGTPIPGGVNRCGFKAL